MYLLASTYCNYSKMPSIFLKQLLRPPLWNTLHIHNAISLSRLLHGKLSIDEIIWNGKKNHIKKKNQLGAF